MHRKENLTPTLALRHSTWCPKIFNIIRSIPIFFTHLGVEAVAKLGDAAGDLVEVDRLLPAVPLDDVHLAHGCVVGGWTVKQTVARPIQVSNDEGVAAWFPAIFSAPAHPMLRAGRASARFYGLKKEKSSHYD